MPHSDELNKDVYTYIMVLTIRILSYRIAAKVKV